jgi:hypothetical protein
MVCASRSLSLFRVLTRPSLCALQEVSAPRLLVFFFRDLTPPCCALQEVSVPLSLGLLTHPSLCALQFVSASRSLGLFACPDFCFPLHSPVCECPSLSRLFACPNLSSPRSPGSECSSLTWCVSVF